MQIRDKSLEINLKGNQKDIELTGASAMGAGAVDE
jgi:hypothetical protein